MKHWSLAPSLIVLRDQINTAAPGRNKKKDGTIGDAAHAAGVSEHNPNAQGVVRAMDITCDPRNGVDCGKLAEDLITELDRRRVKGYVIFNRRIRSTYVSPGKWRYYKFDPHSEHVHVSVETGYDSRAAWSLPSMDSGEKTVTDPGMIGVDGDFGGQTFKRLAFVAGVNSYRRESEAWSKIQSWAGLSGRDVDGYPGPQTYRAIADKVGSGHGQWEPGIVTVLQTYLNGLVSTTPVERPGGGQQAATEAPMWPLPDGHLIGPNPGKYATWHDGAGADSAGRAAIREWQTRMRSRGWTITPDGYWGPNTEKVLRQFQAEKQLGVDGILGPASWAAAWTKPTT